MNSTMRGLAGRVLTIAATTAVMGGAAFGVGVRGASAAELAVTDVGVALSGPQTAVTNGLDALIKATVQNDGLLAAQNVLLTVATGGKWDSRLPLPPNCRVTIGSTDTVRCAYSGLPANTTAPPIQIAVITPAAGTSMTSAASVTTTSPSIVLGDTDKTAQWKTKLSTSAPCGTTCTEAFVPEGGSASFTFTDSSTGTVINQTFSVPSDATWTGGGMLVVLDEVNTTTNHITCGGSPCEQDAGEAKFKPLSSSTPDPTRPVTDTISYSAEDICLSAGSSRLSGGGSESEGSSSAIRNTSPFVTCPPIYGLRSPATSGDASALTTCSPTSSANPDPCVSTETQSDFDGFGNADTVTFTVNALKDLTLPLLSGLAL